MRIAHLSAEVTPFAKTGGLGDVVGALPWAQAQLGHEVAVWMPLYRQVREGARMGRWSLAPVLEPFRMELGFESHEIGLFRSELPGTDVPVYLVSNARFFDRPDVYFADPSGRDDGLPRFSVFVRGALQAMKRLGRPLPEILHAHDWHAALAPMALAWDPQVRQDFGRAASIFTIHNLAYQGVYDPAEFRYLGLPEAARGQTLWHDRVNLMKGGTLAADAVNTVSPSAAREMATSEGGFGLDPVFRGRGGELVGILNGNDQRVWSPERDGHIARRYRPGDLAAKAENRRSLLTMAGMDADDPGFVVGLTGRLTYQKGFDLFLEALDELLEGNVRFALLGSGEPPLEAAMRERSRRSRRRFFAYVGFDDTLAHLIIAGADAFLMPSRFEPCGLSQLYALAYGTPPIVRRAGGLKDTVVPFDGGNAEIATGFAFDEPSARALRDAVRLAQRVRQDPARWQRLAANGAAQDFSWERSARAYLDLYAWRLADRPSGAGADAARPQP